MYKKTSSDWIRWPTTRIHKHLHTHNPLGRKGLNYYTVDYTSSRALRACLPDALQDHAVRVFLVEMQGPYTVHAHTDTGCTSAVNYYLQSGGGITTFYARTSASQPIDSYDGCSVAQAWATHTLETVDSFTAQDRTCWLLNTRAIHDVCIPDASTRRFIQWGFRDTPYEELLCHFE